MRDNRSRRSVMFRIIERECIRLGFPRSISFAIVLVSISIQHTAK